MAEQLTDRTELTTPPVKDDLVLVRDISDLTDGVNGTDKKQKIFNLLRGRAFELIQGCNTLKGGGNSSDTALEAGDFVIYESVSNDALILATIKAAITTVPDDLRDSAKAARWYEGSAML